VTDLLMATAWPRAARAGCAFLDPLADKLLLMASFVTLTWLRRAL
jgi:phosphatidylglycerophosphate synthase